MLPTSPGGIDALGAWGNLTAVGRPGASGVTVAVLDTGIAYRTQGRRFRRSPDFTARQFVEGYDFVGGDRLPLDENGHGTHVAGTIAEKTNNGIGLTGLAYSAKLMPVRVLDRHGSGQADDIADGIRFAANNGADVINMSFNFGCGEAVPDIDEELRAAYRKGVIVVASVGNLGSEACIAPPATGPRVIGVGGSTEGGCLGGYSLRGKGIDVRRSRRRVAGRRGVRRCRPDPSTRSPSRRATRAIRRAGQLRRHVDGGGPRLRGRRDDPRRRRARLGEDERPGRRGHAPVEATARSLDLAANSAGCRPDRRQSGDRPGRLVARPRPRQVVCTIITLQGA